MGTPNPREKKQQKDSYVDTPSTVRASNTSQDSHSTPPRNSPRSTPDASQTSQPHVLDSASSHGVEIVDPPSNINVTTAPVNLAALLNHEADIAARKNKRNKKGARNKSAGPKTTGLSSRSHPMDESPSTVETFRFDVRLETKPSQDPAQEVIMRAKEFFGEIIKLDAHASLHPWDPEAGPSPSALSATQLDRITTLSKLTPFFRPKGGPRVSGGPTHWCINLFTTKTPEDLMQDLRWSFVSSKHGLWLCPIQSADSVNHGWLLYSTDKMDNKKLAASLSKTLGAPVGVRWRVIYTGRGAQARDLRTGSQSKVRAFHLETAKEDADAAKILFRKMYQSQPAVQPALGVRMRLIPEFDNITSPAGLTKFERLWHRQEAFCKHTVNVLNWELANLDHLDRDLGCSLRQLLMALRCQEEGMEHLPLFHSVEYQSWNRGGGYVFVILPQLEKYARPVVAGLYPLLRWIATTKGADPMRIDHYFTSDAVDRMREYWYDPVSKEIRNPDDVAMDSILDDDNEDELMFDLTTFNSSQALPSSGSTPPDGAGSPSQAQQTSPNLRVGNLLGEDDSVTTIQTRSTITRPKNLRSTKRPPDTSSGTASTLSSETFSEATTDPVVIQREITRLQTLLNKNQPSYADAVSNSAGKPRDATAASTAGGPPRPAGSSL